MGPVRLAVNTLLYGSTATICSFAFWTRKAKFVPLSPADPIFSSAIYQHNNPNRNPPTSDLCVRRVPLSSLKPALLEKEGEGRLVEAFCAGVWGGFGYWYQRRYLEKKYRNTTTTAHQLWTPTELLSSSYDVGTQITDHFEVVSKDPSSIIVRCGDSPLNTGVRDSDGLFEMGVEVKREEGVAEFRLKSVFFKGLGTTDTQPMDGKTEYAHRLYTRLWMESAVRNVMI